MDLHPIVAFLIKKKSALSPCAFPIKCSRPSWWLLNVLIVNSAFFFIAVTNPHSLLLALDTSLSFKIVATLRNNFERSMLWHNSGDHLVNIHQFISDVSVRLQAMWRNLGLL